MISNTANWSKEMKYLIPALATFLTTVIAKHPNYASGHMGQIQAIVAHLLTSAIRMEQAALQIASCVFEKIGHSFDQGQFLNAVIFGIMTCLHFYRNNTKSKVIPAAIMKVIHVFFGNLMVTSNSQTLVEACDKVQKGILFMVLKSEG